MPSSSSMAGEFSVKNGWDRLLVACAIGTSIGIGLGPDQASLRLVWPASFTKQSNHISRRVRCSEVIRAALRLFVCCLFARCAAFVRLSFLDLSHPHPPKLPRRSTAIP